MESACSAPFPLGPIIRQPGDQTPSPRRKRPPGDTASTQRKKGCAGRAQASRLGRGTRASLGRHKDGGQALDLHALTIDDITDLFRPFLVHWEQLAAGQAIDFTNSTDDDVWVFFSAISSILEQLGAADQGICLNITNDDVPACLGLWEQHRGDLTKVTNDDVSAFFGLLEQHRGEFAGPNVPLDGASAWLAGDGAEGGGAGPLDGASASLAGDGAEGGGDAGQADPNVPFDGASASLAGDQGRGIPIGSGFLMQFSEQLAGGQGGNASHLGDVADLDAVAASPVATVDAAVDAADVAASPVATADAAVDAADVAASPVATVDAAVDAADVAASPIVDATVDAAVDAADVAASPVVDATVAATVDAADVAASPIDTAADAVAASRVAAATAAVAADTAVDTLGAKPPPVTALAIAVGTFDAPYLDAAVATFDAAPYPDAAMATSTPALQAEPEERELQEEAPNWMQGPGGAAPPAVAQARQTRAAIHHADLVIAHTRREHAEEKARAEAARTHEMQAMGTRHRKRERECADEVQALKKHQLDIQGAQATIDAALRASGQVIGDAKPASQIAIRAATNTAIQNSAEAEAEHAAEWGHLPCQWRNSMSDMDTAHAIAESVVQQHAEAAKTQAADIHIGHGIVHREHTELQAKAPAALHAAPDNPMCALVTPAGAEEGEEGEGEEGEGAEGEEGEEAEEAEEGEEADEAEGGEGGEEGGEGEGGEEGEEAKEAKEAEEAEEAEAEEAEAEEAKEAGQSIQIEGHKVQLLLYTAAKPKWTKWTDAKRSILAILDDTPLGRCVWVDNVHRQLLRTREGNVIVWDSPNMACCALRNAIKGVNLGNNGVNVNVWLCTNEDPNAKPELLRDASPQGTLAGLVQARVGAQASQ